MTSGTPNSLKQTAAGRAASLKQCQKPSFVMVWHREVARPLASFGSLETSAPYPGKSASVSRCVRHARSCLRAPLPVPSIECKQIHRIFLRNTVFADILISRCPNFEREIPGNVTVTGFQVPGARFPLIEKSLVFKEDLHMLNF